MIILGIGNELKYDDGVGPFIISELNKLNLNENVLLINAQTVPENFTGKIRKENPSHIILIDACLMGLNPGEYKIVNEDDFANIGISTHSMSLSYFVKYLMDFHGELTENVKRSASEIIEIFGELL